MRDTLEGVVGGGRQGLQDGVEEAVRLTRDACLVTAAGHAGYFEPSARKRMYHATVGVAGVAPGTALSATPAFAILNPAGSGVAAVLVDFAVGYVSGTLGAGFLAYAQASAPAPPAGELSTVQMGQITGPQTRGQAACRAYSNTSLTNTPTILRPAFNLGAMAAATALLPTPCRDIVDGEFILMPGAFFAVHGIAAAGTTPLVVISGSWYEVPLSLIEV